MRRCLLMLAAVALAPCTSAFCPSGTFTQRNLLPLSNGQCRSTPASRPLMMAEEAQTQTVHARRKFIGRSAGLALAGVAVTLSEKVSAQNMDGGPEVSWYRPPSVTDGSYTGLEWKGPVWKKPEGEPSISYAEFLKALKAGEIEYVDFVGYSAEKVYVRYKATPNERIRIGEGMPDETTPPPKSAECQFCEQNCKPEDKTCSCLSACGGKKDWNSPIYLAKVVRRFRTQFRYSQKDDNSFGSFGNKARRWMMFEGPMSAGLI